MTLEVEITCRWCGMAGTEEPEYDPAPRVCPQCFHDRLRRLVLEQAPAMAEVLDPATLRRWMARQLVEQVGLTAEFAERFAAGDVAWADRKFAEYVLARGVDAP